MQVVEYNLENMEIWKKKTEDNFKEIFKKNLKTVPIFIFNTNEEKFEEELPFLSTNEEMILLIELAEKYFYQLDTIIRSFSDDFEKEVPLLIFKRK
jgi:hypothetical protein